MGCGSLRRMEAMDMGRKRGAGWRMRDAICRVVVVYRVGVVIVGLGQLLLTR
ncbi:MULTISPECIES: hypothetical protein [Bartonella]|uniref:Uncharacterized protein n=1 Tax=Bartonella chomelii TaxID=236402 RepID=A0ABR6E2H1_9HYPH|nr:MULTISPECIES: hypothetical protein [Bartonella]MBA9082760.1 hypothetical protein [Bartonella chomelii]